MRHLVILSSFVLVLAAAVPAFAAQDAPAEKRVGVHLRMGLQGVTAASAETSQSRKLVLANRALVSLRRAHAVYLLQTKASNKALGRAVETGLIQALNVKTRVYLTRGSVQHAKRLNDAALAYATANTEALKLRIKVQKALLVDVYETIQGSRAIERLRDRHATMGTPLRDRGVARRR